VRPRLDRSVGREYFGLDPATYDAVRPGHAPEVYELLRELCGVRAGKKALELGPGTGQATQRLLELGVAPLVALEPNAALARFLRERFGDSVQVRETTLEDAELEPDEYDLAAAASSFHWVEEDAGLGKLRDALRPGGWIAIWWTSFGDELRPDPFSQAVDPLFENIPHGPSGPSEGRPPLARDYELRLAALARAGLEERAHMEFRWERAWDTQGIRGLYSTFSPLSVLEPRAKEAFLDEIARVADEQFGGRVEKPLVTSLYTARKPV
jgi:SAM-dependent methyltransferase